MLKRSGFKDSLNLLRHIDVIEMKTMRESFHDELLSWPGPPQLLPALPKLRKYWNIAEHQIFRVNLGSGTVLVTDDQSRTAYVFEAAILDPQLIRVLLIDRNRSGNVLELRTNQGESGFMLANGRLGLPLKRGIHHRELPSGRGLAGPYSILPTVKVQIDGHVAAVVNAR